MSSALRFPTDWKIVPIGELGEVKLGRQRAPRFTLGNNPKPYLRVVNIFDGKLDLRDVKSMDFTGAELREYRLKYGDVLLTEGDLGSAFNVGRSAVYRSEITDCCFTNTLIRFRKFDDESPSEYFHYVFELLRQHGKFAETTAATTVFHLSSGRLKKVLAPVAPLPQQHKIARILTTLDELIEKTEALIAKYQVIKQGLMHDLFTRGVDEHGHLRPNYEEAPELYKESNRGRFPKSWRHAPLQAYADVVGGVTLGRKLDGKSTVEMPYLRVANVQDGYLDLEEIKTVEVLKSEVERYLLQPGDVVMTEGGDFDKLGRGTIWNGEVSGCLHQNHIFRIRSKCSELNSHFLAHLTGSAYGRHYFLMCAKQTTNLASINATQVKAFPLLLPAAHEQATIVGQLSAVERLVNAESARLRKMTLQKTGLMQDLLTGDVEVTVDDMEAAHV